MIVKIDDNKIYFCFFYKHHDKPCTTCRTGTTSIERIRWSVRTARKMTRTFWWSDWCYHRHRIRNVKYDFCFDLYEENTRKPQTDRRKRRRKMYGIHKEIDEETESRRLDLWRLKSNVKENTTPTVYRHWSSAERISCTRSMIDQFADSKRCEDTMNADCWMISCDHCQIIYLLNVTDHSDQSSVLLNCLLCIFHEQSFDQSCCNTIRDRKSDLVAIISDVHHRCSIVSFLSLHTNNMTDEWTIQSFRTVEILWLKGEKIWTVQFEPRTTQAQMLLMWWQLIMKLQKDHIQVVNRRWMWWSYEDAKWIQRCENCNQKVWIRRKKIDTCMFTWWLKMREFAVKNNTQFVLMKQIKWFLTQSEYCNLNHLVRFGLAYKNEKQDGYWIPRKRRQDFLNGERSVAEYYDEDPTILEGEIWRRTMSEKRISVHEIPNIENVKKQTSWNFTSYTRNESFE